MNEPQLAYLLPALRLIQDAPTAKWSYIDIFWTITIPSNIEFTIVDMNIAGKMNNLPGGETTMEVHIIAPDGDVFAKSSLTGSVEQGDSDITAYFSNLRFDRPGRYSMRVLYSNKVYKDDGKFYFDVKKAS